MDREEFICSLQELGINISEDKLKKLEIYYELLVEKNKVMNLTGITEKSQVFLKHFYDSLTIVKVVNLNEQISLCDIGTGAGFPGMVLKILFPNLKVTLVDSLQKRLNFLQEVIDKLELKDITLIHSRAEEYAKNNRDLYDVVTARAVAPVNILVEYCIPLIKPNKYFVAMKGNIFQEINLLDRSINKIGAKLVKTVEFQLPKENSNRALIVLTKDMKTSKKYPRRNNEIKNNPL